MDDIDAKFGFTGDATETKDAEREKIEYLFFKFVYVKAKLLRKTR